MFHSDFPKFPVRCQTIVDWIGLFTLPFFSLSFSLSVKELASVSFPEKFDGARFLSSSPSSFIGESPIGSRLEGESVSSEVSTRMGWRIFRGREEIN